VTWATKNLQPIMNCLWIDHFLFASWTDIICDWICEKVPFSHIKFLFVYVPWTYMCNRKFIHRGFVDYWKETIVCTFAWHIICQTFLRRQRIVRNTCMQIRILSILSATHTALNIQDLKVLLGSRWLLMSMHSLHYSLFLYELV